MEDQLAVIGQLLTPHLGDRGRYFWIKLIYRIREAYHNHQEGKIWLK